MFNKEIMQINDIVRFAAPENEDERTATMVVVEIRGERVLVKDTRFGNWTIQPTSVYRATDLEKIAPIAQIEGGKEYV